MEVMQTTGLNEKYHNNENTLVGFPEQLPVSWQALTDSL